MYAGWGERPKVDEVMQILESWETMPKAKLLKAFEAGHFAGIEEMKKSESLFRRVAPMAVNDIMMAVQYTYNSAQKPLPVPILAFDGVQDNTIPKNYMKGWYKHTTKYFHRIFINSNHYFVSSHYQEVASNISKSCLDLLEQKVGILSPHHSWVSSNSNKDLNGGPNTAQNISQQIIGRNERRNLTVVVCCAEIVFILLLKVFWQYIVFSSGIK